MKAEVWLFTINNEYKLKSCQTIKEAKDYIISEVNRCRKVEKNCHYEVRYRIEDYGYDYYIYDDKRKKFI